MTDTVEALVDEVDKLASTPDIAVRINDLLGDDESSAWDIGKLIEQDPALSAALLKMANSALYNRGVPVRAVDRAVTMVGAREVRNLAFGICAVNAFEGIPNELITMRDFWRHSLRTAAAAHAIGQRTRMKGRDSLFVGGLLHDIGQLVMYSLRPEASVKALRRSQEMNDGRTPQPAEREVFGFDHTDVGRALAARWQLPEELARCIACHHEPSRADDSQDIVTAVHVANAMAVLDEIESRDLEDAPPLEDDALERLGLTLDDLVGIIDGLRELVGEIEGVFLQQAAAA